MSWSPGIVPLENVPARDLAPLLRQMMDAGSVGNVVHYEPSNVLILTGRASTINKLIEVIKALMSSAQRSSKIIHLEVSSVDSSSNPRRSARRLIPVLFKNAVLVKTGETVVLGGLLDDFSKEQVSKVPLLGAIYSFSGATLPLYLHRAR